jgi:hypothetical protein
MSSYDLVIAKAKAFTADSYADVLRDVADFAGEVKHRVILGLNIEMTIEDETVTAYVMYEG